MSVYTEDRRDISALRVCLADVIGINQEKCFPRGPHTREDSAAAIFIRQCVCVMFCGEQVLLPVDRQALVHRAASCKAKADQNQGGADFHETNIRGPNLSLQLEFPDKLPFPFTLRAVYGRLWAHPDNRRYESTS